MSKRNFIEKQARELLEGMQRRYGQIISYEDVTQTYGQPTVTRFHARMTDQMRALGFTTLGDIRESEGSRSIEMNEIIRIMVSPDGATIAGIKQLSPSLIWRVLMRLLGFPRHVVTFSSWGQDECSHRTTSQTSKSVPPLPDAITVETVPNRTGVLAEYERHLQSAARLPRPLKQVTSLSQLRKLLDDNHEQVRNHLESIGWVTKDCIRANPFTAALTDEIYDEIQRLLATRSLTTVGGA